MTSTSSKSTFVFLCIVSGFLVMLGVLELYNIRSENIELERLLNAVAQAERNDILARSINNIENKSGGELAAFEDLIVTDSSLVKIIENVESAARSMNLEAKIKSVDKVEQNPSGEPQKIRITVETSGSWRNNLAFFKALESLPYRVGFESINLDKSDKVWRSSAIFSLHSFN